MNFVEIYTYIKKKNARILLFSYNFDKLQYCLKKNRNLFCLERRHISTVQSSLLIIHKRVIVTVYRHKQLNKSSTDLKNIG